MRDAGGRAPRRPARQLCLICTIVEGLVVQAEQDLEAGRIEAVREALRRMRAQISGAREDVPEAVYTAPEVS
jgi:hypothetical protein